MIQVYITSAYRAYALADHYRGRGAHVALGGLHVTSLPEEAAAARRHDLPRPGRGHLAGVPGRLPRRAAAAGVYASTVRTLARPAAGPPRPDQAPPLPGAQLDRRLARLPARLRLLLQGGVLPGRAQSFYTQAVDAALAEIERLPGRHLYFLDDHLFGNARFAAALFDGHARHGPAVAGGRHGAVGAASRACWRRRRPAGCAACSSASRRSTRPTCARSASARTCDRDYSAAIRRLHDLGVMVNGSFVFGMDDDDASRLRPHGGVGGRAGHRDGDLPHPHALPRHGAATRAWRRRAHHCTDDWDLYDTRHAVFRPARMIARRRWRRATGGPTATSTAGARSCRGAATKPTLLGRAAPPGLRRRLEEVRAAVGLGHPRQARQPTAARAGGCTCGVGAKAPCWLPRRLWARVGRLAGRPRLAGGLRWRTCCRHVPGTCEMIPRTLRWGRQW